jgi:hypothetical protein
MPWAKIMHVDVRQLTDEEIVEVDGGYQAAVAGSWLVTSRQRHSGETKTTIWADQAFRKFWRHLPD